MKVWKEFCRHIESKEVVKHFGDLRPVVDRCAVFTFTNAQIEAAQEYDPENLAEDGPSIPPFPFPEMCMVGTGGVIMLRQPEMDDEGVLEFKILRFAYYGPEHHPTLNIGTCRVDTTALDDDGKFIIETHDAKNFWDGWLWSTTDELIDQLIAGARQDEVETLELAERIERALNEAKKKGKKEHIEKLTEARAETEVAINDFVVNREKAEVAISNLAQMQSESIEKAFYLGLQEVNWINHPSHYTVEINPPSLHDKKKKRKKETRIRRIPERSRYIILTKEEIVSEWHRVHRGGTHASPIPHLRRGHYRTLRSERYREKKRIWVRATHVNGHSVEWRDGDVFYRVI